MNGQILTRLENLERELKKIKSLVKSQASGQPNLALSQIAKKLQKVGEKISPKELDEEIRAVRSSKNSS